MGFSSVEGIPSPPPDLILQGNIAVPAKPSCSRPENGSRALLGVWVPAVLLGSSAVVYGPEMGCSPRGVGGAW